MERRPPIAPEHKTVDHRLYYHSQHPYIAKQHFGYVLDANAAVLRPVFERLESDYVTGSTSERAWDGQMERVRGRPDLLWHEDEIKAIGPHLEERLRAARAVEAGAEIVLRSMDDLLTSITVAFTGRERVLDLGQQVAPGVPLDRVLDAVGNYIRHRQEWRASSESGTPFTNQQMDSIRPLARVIAGRPDVDGNEAYAVLFDEPFPMLRVLDALSAYTTAVGAGSYDALQAAIYESGTRIIDERFPAWWDERRKVLAAADDAAKGQSG